MQIHTERLVLREFNFDDWPAIQAYQSDPHYLRFYAWTERSPAEVQDFVRMFLKQQEESPRRKFQLAATLKTNGELIGNCGIRLAQAGAHQGDIGYELAPEHWGQGYATEAARAIVNLGFTHLELQRIWSWCIADNRASAHVLEKLGMQLEGRLRQNEFFKDRFWDTLMYAVLKSEWQALPYSRTHIWQLHDWDEGQE